MKHPYLTLVTVLALALPGVVLAGPPLICHPYDIGKAKSLPWAEHAQSWQAIKSDYDVRRLPEDTLALLNPDTPVIVRMETMRRALAYMEGHPQIGAALLERLRERAMTAKAGSPSAALAWFDFGYLVETFRQADRWIFKGANPAAGLDGYSWVTKAIALRGNDPEMEFAAAIITVDSRKETPGGVSTRKDKHTGHLQNAVAGAKEASLLARNLVRHFENRGKTIAELRATTGLAGKP